MANPWELYKQQQTQAIAYGAGSNPWTRYKSENKIKESSFPKPVTVNTSAPRTSSLGSSSVGGDAHIAPQTANSVGRDDLGAPNNTTPVGGDVLIAPETSRQITNTKPLTGFAAGVQANNTGYMKMALEKAGLPADTYIAPAQTYQSEQPIKGFAAGVQANNEGYKALAEKPSFGNYVGRRFVGGAAEAAEGTANAAGYWYQDMVKSGELQADNAKRAAAATTNNEYAKKAIEDLIEKDKPQNVVMRDTKEIANFGDNYVAKTEEKFADVDFGFTGKLMGDVAEGTGGMIAKMPARLVPGLGDVITFASAYGNAKQSALKNGAVESEASIYALGTAAIELATEKMFGFVGGLGNGFLDNKVAGLIGKAAGKFADSETVKVALNIIMGATGEGFEEFIAEIAQGYLDKLTIKTDERNFWQILGDGAYNAIVGNITAMLFGVSSAINGGNGTLPTANEIEELTTRAAIQTEAQIKAEANTAMESTNSDSDSPKTKQNIGDLIENNLNVPRVDYIGGSYLSEEHHGNILDGVRQHLSEIEGMQPVSDLAGTEFQKTESDQRSLRERVLEFFDSIGNKVFRRGMGDIALNKAGVRDSLGHGYGKLKAATFAALPKVLSEGKIISYDPNFEGRDYASYLIAAPVTVNREICYVGAYVIKDINTQRYKLHEVLTIKKDGTESFKTEAPEFGSDIRDTAPSVHSIPQVKTQVNGKADGETSPLHSANPKSENQIPMDKFLYTEALMRKAEREGKIYTQRLLQKEIEEAQRKIRKAKSEASSSMPTIYSDRLKQYSELVGFETTMSSAKSAEKEREGFENALRSSIIDIDELTPCLRRLSDDSIVNTVVCDVIPSYTAFFEWEFDWTKPPKNGFTVRAIKAVGDDRIQGMIALKADDRNSAVLIDIVEAAPFNNPHNPQFVSKEYSGIGGHLFAEAVRESYKHGYGGYVYFKAKTELIDYYHEAFGAVLINPRERIMAIEEGSAKKLYDRYYMGE